MREQKKAALRDTPRVEHWDKRWVASKVCQWAASMEQRWAV